MRYPRDLVARIKGALRAGLKPKQIAYLTKIDHETIKQWANGDARADVPPEDLHDDIAQALLGRFNGSVLTR